LTDPDAALDAALAAHRSGDLIAAEAAYRSLLADHPDHAESHHFFGVLLHQTGRHEAAATAYRRAHELEPGNADYANSLGVQLKALGLTVEAQDAFSRARGLAPAAFGPAYNLGNLLLEAGEPEAALDAYGAALAIEPGNVDAQLNRATTLQMLGRLADAEAAITGVLDTDPANAAALNNLGNVARTRGDTERARDLFRRALDADAASADAAHNLGAAEIDRGDVVAARQAFGHALHLRPGFLKARWFDALSLPVIYDAEDQIDEERARWSAGLERLEAELHLDTPAQVAEALAVLAESCNFALAYQGRDDLSLQRRYAGLVGRIANAAFPGHEDALRSSSRAKPKVLFISAFLRDHTVARLFGGWVRGLDRDRFGVEAMMTAPGGDAVTDGLARACDAFHRDIPSLAGLVARIAETAPDIIIYLDMGMDPRAQVLAALRLAPVQCVAFGHPVTSGFSTIDAFLSGELQEPEEAEAHYAERLRRLPGIGLSYSRPAAPLTQASVGSPVFLCTQSLFKLAPAQDAAFVELARAVPGIRLRFVAHGKRAVTERFQMRLSAAFKAAGLDAGERLEITPQCSRPAFLALHADATAVLDSFRWSGGNTSYEALALGLPVVTLAGQFMRGRVTAAMHEQMGLGDQVAVDELDWVERATRLATDTGHREDVVAAVREASPVLFNDGRPVAALADVLEKLSG